MTDKNIDQFKILEKYGCKFSDSEIEEIKKNISQLAEVILIFENRKKHGNRDHK